MASLKSLKSKISTVNSSCKITKAMKMVAASKLRRAKEAILNNAPYTEKLINVVNAIKQQIDDTKKYPMLFGRDTVNTVLIISISSDRGLCGAFNANIAKETKNFIKKLKSEGKKIQILSIGVRAFGLLSAHYSDKEISLYKSEHKNPAMEDAVAVGKKVTELFSQNNIDECHLVYNKFFSAVSQKVIYERLLPVNVEKSEEETNEQNFFLCEPPPESIANDVAEHAVSIGIFRAMLENAASEHGARMTAMDNASRNAEEMIRKLKVKYNRMRQAAITTELSEIISGAEAIK